MLLQVINYRGERLAIPVKRLEEYATETGVNRMARLARRVFRDAYAHAAGACESIRVELEDGSVYPARFFFGNIIWHI